MSTGTVAQHVETEVYDDIALDEGGLASSREVPAWAVSLAVHLVVLGLLWTIALDREVILDSRIDSEIVEIDPEALAFSTMEDRVGSDSSENLLSPSQSAAKFIGRDPQKEIEKQIEEVDSFAPQLPVNRVEEPPVSELLAEVDTFGATEDVGGTEGAIDRLVYEIENSLKERKTLVIWLFDASQSLNERREQIARRFENIYAQLRQRNDDVHKALKTAVVSYGEQTEFLTSEPVDDPQEAVAAARRIIPDESGREYVFTAVLEVVGKWRNRLLSYRSHGQLRRNVMMIIVTDERGDDYAGRGGKQYLFLERVIAQTRRMGIKVYCVGNAAVFGREKGYVTFREEDGYVWNNVPVDQGPETVRPERLQLPFWTARSADVERMTAAYGPYALTRLCAATGGLYLITEHSRSRFKFDPAVMRNYAPDYRPIPEYDQELMNNPAKRALVEVATMTMKRSIPQPQRTFQASNDNVLRQQITQAQRPFADLEYHLDELLAPLAAAEKARAQIAEPRWRAGFDLAMGRLLAMKVRAFGYNSVLAEMSRSPKEFQRKGSNMWRLVPSHEIDGYEPKVRQFARQAKMYLERVLNEHPGTPWAVLAEHELSIPMGWEWREGTMRIAQNNRGNRNNDPGIQLAEDEQRRRERMRKKQSKPRQMPKL